MEKHICKLVLGWGAVESTATFLHLCTGEAVNTSLSLDNFPVMVNRVEGRTAQQAKGVAS